MEGTITHLAEALRILEERVAADFKDEPSDEVECSTKEEDDLSFPPGLDAKSEQTTVAHISGSTSNASTLSPPPGLNGTEAHDADMPKKIPLPERPFDVLRAFQAGRSQVAEKPAKKESSKKATTREARPLKKFCAFCGMQVDPEYLTAKFCAFCGAEHVQMTNSIHSTGVLPPMHHQACWQTYDDYSHGSFLHGEEFYDMSLAWEGAESTTWDTSETGEFDTYDYSCPFSASTAASWPPQGMAW